MKPVFTRAQAVLLYFACWVPLLLIFTAAMRSGAAPGWISALFFTTSYLLPAVAFGSVYWFILGAAVPWNRLSWPVLVGVECINAVVYTVGWTLVFGLLLRATAGSAVAHEIIGSRLPWQMAFGLVIYGLHAAIFHAVRLLGDLRRNEASAIEAENLRIRAEMAALRGQLNPHFLFNSLHSILALLRQDPRRAEEALLQFSDLLRRVLAGQRGPTDEVRLADEMRLVQDYLAIERLRLGDRLRVECDLTAEALECWLPAFSVQPFVENAIVHAIAPRRDGGTLTLCGRVEAGRLSVQLSDDGPGADPAVMAQTKGVGIDVTRRRLQARHGAAASLTIDTAPGRGFRTTLVLPATHEPLGHAKP